MLNFYFKSTFSVKPSKFQIYFANDCRFYPHKVNKLVAVRIAEQLKTEIIGIRKFQENP